MSKQKEYRARFWENYRLEELNNDEWEALCDGCGKCCLRKIEDADTNEVFYTNAVSYTHLTLPTILLV